MQRTYQMTTSTMMLRDRVARALMTLGLIGAVATLFTGINGVVGVVLIIALIDAVIEFGLWIVKKVRRYMPG